MSNWDGSMTEQEIKAEPYKKRIAELEAENASLKADGEKFIEALNDAFRAAALLGEDSEKVTPSLIEQHITEELVERTDQLVAMTTERDEAIQDHSSVLDCWEKESDRADVAEEEHDAAVTAFEKYGEHRPGCVYRLRIILGGPCDCGYDRTKAALNKDGGTGADAKGL